MMGVVFHPADLLDDFSDPVERPEVSLESPFLWSLFEGRRKMQAILRAQSRHSASAASAAQSVPSLASPNVIPTMGSRPAYIESTDHFCLKFALAEQRGGLEPAVLQGFEVPPRPDGCVHVFSLQRQRGVLLYYASLIKSPIHWDTYTNLRLAAGT